jgi:hypothetical protein
MAERDYKDEYKKFQSSDKSKKYRAELNKYNRDRGTYGNGDGKDATHKDGKIAGFEDESKNKGRREKSRLKKEMNIREIIREHIHFMLMEGGNIPGVNSVLPKEYLSSSVENGLQLAGLGKLKYTVVGNKNKPFLGDVDVAVNGKDVAYEIGYSGNDPTQFWFELDEFLSKNKKIKGYKVVKGLKQFHLIVPLVDNSKKQTSAFGNDGNTLPEPGFIQLDFFIGDLKWMKNALSASADDSKYKAVYRNLFLVDILSQLQFKTKDPDIKRKFQIDWKEGIELVDFTTDEKGKRKKLKIRKVSGDMDKFARFLFGAQFKFTDINSFEKLYKLFKSNKFHYPKMRKNILDAFRRTIQNYKLELPKELK